jgi:hypothetical protein
MTQPASQTPQDASVSWLMQAMIRMVRPVVRFAVGRVSCNALVDLIREVYVLEARDYLEQQNPERKVTRSALALLCGMDGRAIKMFEGFQEREYAPSDLCSEAAILETWMTDPDFCDADTGRPRELLIHGPQGTFQRLVSRSAGRAVTPQTALDRLVESGNVDLDETGTRVRMIDPSYMLVPSSEQSTIEAASFAINRLGKTVIHNSSRRFDESKAPWLQQDRWSLRIPRERLELIRADLRALLKKHIEQVEGFLEDEEHRPSDTVECSLGVGWYYWEDLSNDHPVKRSANIRRQAATETGEAS